MKIFSRGILFLLLFCSSLLIAEENTTEIRIDKIASSYFEPEKKQAIELVTLFLKNKVRLNEQYDVYANKEIINGQIIYTDFIDTVILSKIDPNKNWVYFSYYWTGAKKNLKPGFYVIPTKRKKT